jgi:DNA-binding transcriptional LysR family regulator
MELRHLRYFIAVAEHRHITRAAAQLGIQQPPLTQQIQALERELGVSLLRRHARGVELTPAGESFLADALDILQMVDRAVEAAGQTARGQRGRVRIGMTNSTPFHPLLPRVIRAFRETAPNVVLTLQEGGTGELVDAVRAGRLDGAFTRSAMASASDLVVEVLLKEELVVALPARHPLAESPRGDPRVRLQLLAEDDFILYRRPNGPGLYDTILTACHRAGFSPKISQEVPVITSTLNLVAAGLGVSVVPASLSRHHLEGIVYAALAGRPKLLAPLNLTYRRGPKSAAFEGLIEVIHSVLSSRTSRQSAGISTNLHSSAVALRSPP